MESQSVHLAPGDFGPRRQASLSGEARLVLRGRRWLPSAPWKARAQTHRRRRRSSCDKGEDFFRLGPMLDRDRIRQAEPPLGVVLLVEHRLPTHRYFHRKVLDFDLVDSGEVLAPPVVRHLVLLPDANVDDDGVEARLLAEFAPRGFGERLALLDDACDDMPVIVDRAMEHQVALVSIDDHRDLASGPQSAATAACIFAVASPAEVPAAKKMGSPKTTSTSPRHPLERAGSHARSR